MGPGPGSAMLQAARLNWLDATPSPPLGPRDLHVWLIPPGDADGDDLRPVGPGGGAGPDGPRVGDERWPAAPNQPQDEGADASPLWALLSAREQGRASRIRLARQRSAYLRVHAGLRLILAGYLGQAPERIRFEQGPQGKPSLPGALEFNLTTSGDLALVALRWRWPLGIDCERTLANRDHLAIARRLFAPAEVEHLRRARDEDRPSLFTRYWTALEARVKLDGRGLFQPPPAAAIPSEVIHFTPQAGYLAAIASPQPPPLASWSAWRLVFPTKRV